MNDYDPNTELDDLANAGGPPVDEEDLSALHAANEAAPSWESIQEQSTSTSTATSVLAPRNMADEVKAWAAGNEDGPRFQLAEVENGLVVRAIEPYIQVDAADSDKMAIRMLRYSSYGKPDQHDGATYDDLEKLRMFPQGKYSQRENAFVIPLTEPNVEHLLRSWGKAALTFTDAGKLLVEYHLKTKLLAQRHLKERLRYLETDEVDEAEGFIYNTTPYKHQVVACKSARRAEYFAFLMEMGTGKTKVGIDVLCDRARRLRLEKPGAQLRALVVAPKTVTHTWMREFEKHTSIDCNIERLVGSVAGRIERLKALIRDRESPLLIAVINYEGMVAIKDGLKMIPWDVMVLDESIWIKNPSAQRSKAAKEIGEIARSRFIMTGLPITRNIMDLYGQFDFLKEGSLGFTSKYAYKSYYYDVHDNGSASSLKSTRMAELQERMAQHAFVIRRHQCIELPEKQYQTLEIEMGDDQARAYDAMLEDMIVSLEDLKEGKVSEDEAREADDLLGSVKSPDSQFSIARVIVVKFLRLAQITSGFLKMADKSIKRFEPNPKVEAVEELIEELGEEDKIVIWARFREDIDHLYEQFKSKYGAVVLYGGQGDRTRENNLKRFESDPSCRVFIGQPQSGGYGLNELVVAHNVVYFSNDFAYSPRQQSEDRCHRIGQKNNVLYTDLVVPKSIDEMILERLRLKKDLSDLLTDRKRIIAALRSQLLDRKRAREE